jgi:hypothetical protein
MATARNVRPLVFRNSPEASVSRKGRHDRPSFEVARIVPCRPTATGVRSVPDGRAAMSRISSAPSRWRYQPGAKASPLRATVFEPFEVVIVSVRAKLPVAVGTKWSASSREERGPIVKGTATGVLGEAPAGESL